VTSYVLPTGQGAHPALKVRVCASVPGEFAIGSAGANVTGFFDGGYKCHGVVEVTEIKHVEGKKIGPRRGGRRRKRQCIRRKG